MYFSHSLFVTGLIVIAVARLSAFPLPASVSKSTSKSSSTALKNLPYSKIMRVRGITKHEMFPAANIPSFLSIPRAGGTISSAIAENPVTLFNSILTILAIFAVALKSSYYWVDKERSTNKVEFQKAPAIKRLQWKYLSAFWLLRCGYWMSGPYVVPAYKSKIFGGVQASMALVSKIFLTGFAFTAILGPSLGQATDRYGRKAGTILFALLYGIGCASIKFNTLWILFAGRAIIGCALSLLFTAPEAWINGEASRTGLTPYLGEIFGLAYTGDALVAIIAGKLASLAAEVGGLTAPFDFAIIFLAAGALITALAWKENKALTSTTKITDSIQAKKTSSLEDSPSNGMMEALEVICKDERLMLVGAVQSLFEAAMYVFILQWTPVVSQAINAVFGDGAVTPFGTIFSCFMTCSLLGSLWFGKFIGGSQTVETMATGMLGLSTLSMALAAVSIKYGATSVIGLVGILLALFSYQGCVGMYFPTIGTIRSKFIPDDKKSVILSLFGVPLNTLVVIIYLSISKLGASGSLGVAAGALAMATCCMMKLRAVVMREETVGAAA